MVTCPDLPNEAFEGPTYKNDNVLAWPVLQSFTPPPIFVFPFAAVLPCFSNSVSLSFIFLQSSSHHPASSASQLLVGATPTFFLHDFSEVTSFVNLPS